MVKFLGVAALAAIDIFLAVPAGMAAGYGFVEQFLAMVLGGVVSAVVVVFLGDAAQHWWQAHKKVRSRPKPVGMIGRLADKWGAPGLGLLAPVVVGTPAGAMIGIGLGLDRAPLLSWLIAGVVIWSAVLAGLVAVGVTAIS